MAEEIIRHLFMNRIVDMKGLGDIIKLVDGPIVPTPAAVLDAGLLLSQGTSGHDGLGELMLVDIGGATTDIHSYAEHTSYEGARLVGQTSPMPEERLRVIWECASRPMCWCVSLGWNFSQMK